MSEDWFMFKEAKNLKTMEYLGYLSHRLSTKEKNKQFSEESNKHNDCIVWAMKVIKGIEV